MDPLLVFVLELVIIAAMLYLYLWLRVVSRRVEDRELDAKLDDLEEAVAETTKWMERASAEIRGDIDDRTRTLRELLGEVESRLEKARRRDGSPAQDPATARPHAPGDPSLVVSPVRAPASAKAVTPRVDSWQPELGLDVPQSALSPTASDPEGVDDREPPPIDTDDASTGRARDVDTDVSRPVRIRDTSTRPRSDKKSSIAVPRSVPTSESRLQEGRGIVGSADSLGSHSSEPSLAETVLVAQQVKTEAPPEPPSAPPDRKSQILDLVGQGLSSVEIAERVGTSRAEIEMVLAMQRRRSR